MAEVNRLGLAENTIIIVTSDHGEMLGEHGMWYKRCFFDPSVRVPFIVAWPGTWSGSRRVKRNASLVDLFPTLCDMVDIDILPEIAGRLEGQSLLPWLEGEGSQDGIADDLEGHDDVIVEYYGEGVIHAGRMLCRGDYKYIYVHDCEPQLYDLTDDPHEMRNRACDPAMQPVCAAMRKRLLQGWDPAEMERRVIEDQQIRLLLRGALQSGEATRWDYAPPFDATRAYVRSHDAQETSRKRRFPRGPRDVS